MKYLTGQDMPYFRRLAEDGKAIIIEISDQALLQIDPDSFRKPSGEIDRKSLEEALHRQEPVLMEMSREGELFEYLEGYVGQTYSDAAAQEMITEKVAVEVNGH